jgi:enoyl-CoA hydratase/carnithine racemase
MSGPAARPFVQASRQGDVVTLRLDHPETLNRLASEAQFLELAGQIRSVAADTSVRALVITGQGAAFCAGGDIRNMAAREGFSAGTAADIEERYRRSVHQVPRALSEIDIPTIAAVNGPAYGAGCDLACFCDIRLAARNASFSFSFVQLGIVPGDGGAWMLPRLIGRSNAMEMAFTADPVDAETALRIGLVSQVVDGSQLLDRAHAIANRIAQHPARAVRMTKRLLRDAEHTTLAKHLDLAAAFQAIAHLAPEHLVAVAAVLARLQQRGSPAAQATGTD